MEPIENPWFFKRGRNGLVVAVALLFVNIIVPSKSTCYKMLVASMVTPNNITIIGEKTEKALDTLIEKIIETARELENGNKTKC